MTAPQDQSFPLFPPKSTELRLANFDSEVFVTDPTTVIYKLADALCGDAGASALKKGSFITRLGTALETICFSDLDYIFGNISFLSRSPEESYPYNPSQDMLTSSQWDEVKVKDSWYRDRIRKFFIACGMGGTPDGMRQTTMAVTSADCDIYEVWRYMDNYGLTQSVNIGNNTGVILGRAPVSTRQEVVISPHKTTLTGHERRLLGQMLSRIAPIDTVVTINAAGVPVLTPVNVHSAAADSSYFQVEKTLTATPVLSQIPPPELLAIDLMPSEQWMFNPGPNIAPYTAFNITQEYGYYYLVGGGARSPIDSVTYGTLGDYGGYSDVYLPDYGTPVNSTAGADQQQVVSEPDFQSVAQIGEYTPWQSYALADSPDNFPGGKYGLTPNSAPALNPDHTAYVFPYPSQAAYVAQVQAAILAQGGIANELQYRLPLVQQSTTAIDYTADLAIAYNAPTRDSTVTSSWLGLNLVPATLNLRDPSSFWGS